MPTKLEKDAAAAGLSVEDYQAQLAAQEAARASLSEEDRAALEQQEAANADAVEDAAKLREQLAAAEQRAASADAKVSDLESQLASVQVGAGGAVGGTVTTNARGEVVTE